MLKYLAILALLSFSDPDLSGTYYSQRRICYLVYAEDSSWNLTLQKDSSFTYKINAFYKDKDHDTSFLTKGTWTVANDKLILKTYTYPYVYFFTIKDKTLIPVTSREGLMQPEYMIPTYLNKNP